MEIQYYPEFDHNSQKIAVNVQSFYATETHKKGQTIDCYYSVNCNRGSATYQEGVVTKEEAEDGFRRYPSFKAEITGILPHAGWVWAKKI